MRATEFLNEFQLPKNKWELVVSNGDKEELGTDLVSLVRQAYTNTPQGSFVNSIKDVIPSDWNVIDWDQDPDVDSCVFYRKNRNGENWQGYKLQGLGHDGTRTSKDKAINKIQQLLSKPGVWIESSDAMRHVLKKLNVPAVTDERLLQQLFNDPKLKMIDDDTYVRQLSDGTKVTETVFGSPKIMRATEFTNENTVDEMALKQFTPMGDFNKPGPFKGVDRRLVPHATNQLKTAKFFENTPYDFRLFFSNIPGTGKYSETGPVNGEQLRQMFGDEYASQIMIDSDDAITVVFVGNSGDSKVMMTPWIMAHRFGHAIQAGVRRNNGWSAWTEAEKHFFRSINSTLEDYYGKVSPSRMGVTPQSMRGDLTPEYNALFNAIGTQRSSRTGQIKRPYEFLYEIFAQYLKTGEVTFNPLPGNLGYGRKAWGTPTKYLNIKPEYRDENERAEASSMLANDMKYMFDDVLSSSVGKIFVM